MLLLLPALASAGTVTLTGQCAKSDLNSSTVNFTLLNSGNDTAFNLVLTPVIEGAKVEKSIYEINNITPNTAAKLEINVTNITARGRTGGYFLVTYQQGTEIFSAVFSCLIDFFNATGSQILISPKASVSANGNSTVLVSAYNAGLNTIKANISLILPRSFRYKSSSYYVLEIAPSQTANVTFSLEFAAGQQAAYSVAALASYIEDNLSHATLSSFIIAASVPSKVSLNLLFLVLTVIVVVAILFLIFVSLMRKKKQG